MTTAPQLLLDDAPDPELLQIPGGYPDMDARARDILHGAQTAAREGQDPDPALLVRLVCNLYDPVKGHYTSWPGVRWGLKLFHVEQATEFRHSLDEFVRLWIADRQTPPPAEQPE